MKKFLLIPLLALAAWTAQAQSPNDLNNDGDVNVGDVTALVNMILGKVETSSNADLNKDGDVNVGDVTKLVNVILGKEKPDFAVEEGFCPDGNHPHIINMGAAGKWACCNVGAKMPTDVGGYYAWGETEEKEDYSQETYQYYKDGSSIDIGADISGNKQYDVATAKWGDDWKMPALDRITSLVDNCSYELKTIGSVRGGVFTASNGNRLFLPMAGERYGTDLYHADYGYYWSSTLGLSSRAYYLSLFGSAKNDDDLRYCGLSVRPVVAMTDPAVEATICPDENHPHIIDMGAAGHWSCCNVGASKPTDYGGYYAWGETEEKEDYSQETYQYYKDGKWLDLGDISGNKLYDVATAKWGEDWKMPTIDAIRLLIACTNKKTTLGGVHGHLFTAANGNRLFLPDAEAYNSLRSNAVAGEYGCYWSSSLDPSDTDNRKAYHLSIGWYSPSHPGSCEEGLRYRNTGFSVRPVAVVPDAAVEEGYCPDSNHPHVIDMGEAGKWSCCNVGASMPTDYGGYFAWGETEEKKDYSKETYQYYKDDKWLDLGDINGNKDYDVATAKWGDDWQMPTHDRNLKLLSCSSKWTTLGGVEGRTFTALNGNRLFLPAAGWREGRATQVAGEYGSYWTSTPDAYSSNRAYFLLFNQEEASQSYYTDRTYGRTVRPVQE